MNETDKVEQLKYDWSKDGMVLTVSKPDGTRTETFDTREVHAKVRQNLFNLGFRTNLGYQAPAKASHDMKLDCFMERMAELRDGDWEAEREKLPDWIKTAEMRLAIEAAARLKGCDPKDFRKSLKDFPEEEARKILDNPKIKAKIAEMKAAGESLDVSEFLS